MQIPKSIHGNFFVLRELSLVFTILTCMIVFSSEPSVASASSPAAPDAPGINLLQNSNFENGLVPWQSFGNGQIGVQNCCARRKAWSAFIRPNANQHLRIFQKPHGWTAGRRYRLIAWAYTEGMVAELGWFSDVDGDHPCANTAAGAYVKLVCDFTIPAGTTVFDVHIGGTGAAPAQVITDRWILTPICVNGYCRAQAYKEGEFYGVSAIISTPNPAIREHQMSFATINIIGVPVNGVSHFIETGIIKSSTQDGDCMPKFMWAIPGGGANTHFIDDPLPIVGREYAFDLYKTGAGRWQLDIWDMETVQRIFSEPNIAQPNVNRGNEVQAAGEVFSPLARNDMGISGLRALLWKTNGVAWQLWNGWDTAQVDAPPYAIRGIPDDVDNNVQIAGNNGRRIPNNAPCAP